MLHHSSSSHFLSQLIFICLFGFFQEQLLLGPAYGIAQLLERNNLTLNDIDVFEIHEAFAGQVLACLNALDSEVFARDYLKRSKGKVVSSSSLCTPSNPTAC